VKAEELATGFELLLFVSPFIHTSPHRIDNPRSSCRSRPLIRAIRPFLMFRACGGSRSLGSSSSWRGPCSAATFGSYHARGVSTLVIADHNNKALNPGTLNTISAASKLGMARKLHSMLLRLSWLETNEEAE
jgi:hypothetical protein